MNNQRTVVVIPGDGIGPEITEPVLRILEKTGAPLKFVEHHAGALALEQEGELLPDDTLEAIRSHKLALKGPITTPVGKGFRSLNVTLRQTFDLYANVRPVRTLPGAPSRYSNIDLIIVRENTEDLYAGIENQVDEDTAESIKRITRRGSERIAKFALDLALREKRKKVQAAHKANIMKLSDGLFLKSFYKMAEDYSQLETGDVIIDACCMQLVRWPEAFDVVVTENLYGDILSDLCAGLVGGLGIVPGANIGEDIAIFEAVHGSAPDIAGQNKANPTALLQSGVMLLKHLDLCDEASKVEEALIETLSNPLARTGDLGGKASTSDFTKALLSNL